MLTTPKAWKGCNFLNTYLKETSEESIGIDKKSKCQWSGYSIEIHFEQRSYVCLKLHGSRNCGSG